jgi:single-stranded-DNA-specific exonuclease
VLGIVASKIVEEYKMTAFVWGRDENGFIKGSGRSWGDTDLVNLLSLLPRDVLIEFGGHKGACGFTVKEDEIYFLEDKIVSVYDRESTKETQDELKYEAILSVEDVNNENYKTIEKLAPYGKDNPKPIFLFKNLQIFSVKEFGKEKNHLELSFKDNNKRNIKAIAFFKTRDSYKNTLKEGDQIDLLASIEKNNFLGKSEIRLRINDIVVK